MIEFTIQGTFVEFNENKEYYDYFGDRGVVRVRFQELLEKLSSEELSLDGIEDWLLPMTRWLTEAPRKRFYRAMQKDCQKFHILSGEQWFLEEGGEEIIDKLENTGKLAQMLLRTIFNNNKIMIVKNGGIIEEIEVKLSEEEAIISRLTK